MGMCLAVATFKPAGKELPKAGDTVGKNPTAKAYLDVVIANKDETWAYSIREYGPGYKVAGTVYFENFEVLKRFLVRTGAEAGGPKAVFLTGPWDTKPETVQAIVEVCKAAGLQGPAAIRHSTSQTFKWKFKLPEQPDPK